MTSPFEPVGVWPPRTEEAIKAAAEAGHLDETHVLELKRELPSGDAANKELAADLASLAIDGGLLIIGVDEDAGPGLTPVLLDGLAERVEQVARTRIDEPLHVTFAPITSTAQPGRGYLQIRVPASPRAPHMVGHRYWGRGDKTKHQLSDAEVERLMALRQRWAADTEQVLREWMAADSIAPSSQQYGHLFVVASLVPQRERLLLPVFSGDWTSEFRRLVSSTSHAGGRFVPDIDYLTSFSTTPCGWAWSSYAVFGERLEGEAGADDREGRALKIEICEDGQLRLICGRAAEKYQMPPGSGSITLFLYEDLILALTARMVSLAGRVSDAAGFVGSWDFGVGITGLRDSRAYSRTQLVQFAGLLGPPYTQDTYTSTTRAAVTEIEAGTGPVVERLLGRLMRAVGVDQIPSVKTHFGA